MTIYNVDFPRQSFDLSSSVGHSNLGQHDWPLPRTLFFELAIQFVILFFNFKRTSIDLFTVRKVHWQGIWKHLTRGGQMGLWKERSKWRIIKMDEHFVINYEQEFNYSKIITIIKGTETIRARQGSTKTVSPNAGVFPKRISNYWQRL